ncbi:LOB domain-containing protein 38-like [Ipomoea triloba]|uniref:LOB domain-containing protein 38-like n=1 Tax=Ipomoea triloba TaxID=35885 RepID=UPI00125D5E9E|nr:LOB domain-containing protein 38-like [Ipomoea triloba]GLL23749.1 LOB domain-containing protein 38-like [Ipomoea trifida]
MSCNGCRILRKGCNDNCILRQSLQGIESPQAQANATVFVAKFFGRAGLMSFLSSVPESQRPALFQSLLLEACGRTVNPVHGAVGLLWTGNWHVCQAAVEAVLRGGTPPRPLPEFTIPTPSQESDEAAGDLDLGLTTAARMTGNRRVEKKRRADTPSEESEISTLESGFAYHQSSETNLLRLFF